MKEESSLCCTIQDRQWQWWNSTALCWRCKAENFYLDSHTFYSILHVCDMIYWDVWYLVAFECQIWCFISTVPSSFCMYQVFKPQPKLSLCQFANSNVNLVNGRLRLLLESKLLKNKRNFTDIYLSLLLWVTMVFKCLFVLLF